MIEIETEDTIADRKARKKAKKEKKKAKKHKKELKKLKKKAKYGKEVYCCSCYVQISTLCLITINLLFYRINLAIPVTNHDLQFSVTGN